MEENTSSIIRLNLGCGTDYREGYVNIDIDRNVKTDWCGDACNMPKGYRYSMSINNDVVKTAEDWTDRFDEIYSHHALEHFKDLLTIVKEMVRVSKDGALWTIIVPYCTWMQGVCNPHHHILFHETTFDFFGQKYKRGHKEDWTLEVLDIKYGWSDGYDNETGHMYRHQWLNVVKDITFTIKVHK